LFLAYNGPYVLGNMMLNASRNRHVASYRGHQFVSFPNDAMHPWQWANKQFHNTQLAKERAACEVSGVDDGVGEIMTTLQRLNLDQDTLVVYASDQGWMGGQNGMWGMGDHFRPTGAHELMMQIPLIFRHTGRIAKSSVCDHLVSNYDFLPTVLGYLGLQSKLPAQPKSPGRDFSPLLRGDPVSHENIVFYEMETCRAVRDQGWKYVARFPLGPFELYDMQSDPRERVNLYGQPVALQKQQELAKRLDDFFTQYADPQYDIWKAGRSKAKRHTL